MRYGSCKDKKGAKYYDVPLFLAPLTFTRDSRENENYPRSQPRSQGLSLPAPKSERRETLVWSGHVRPKIWDVANKRLVGGADECEFCLYLV